MSQKWFQLKCIRKKRFTVTGVALLSFVLPHLGYALKPMVHTSVIKNKKATKNSTDKVSRGTDSRPNALPKLLQEVEEKYSKSITLTANFDQVNEDAALSQKKQSSGKIFFKRPSKIRWETLKPDSNLLVSDGEHFWFYTPPFDEGESGQLVERKSSEVKSKLANALLSGSFSVAKDMKIKIQTPSTFLLIPKPGTAGTVTQAEIKIDPDQKLIQKVILEHKGGNRSEITLSQIELGKPLENQLFDFKAPPNTDKVDSQN